MTNKWQSLDEWQTNCTGLVEGQTNGSVQTNGKQAASGINKQKQLAKAQTNGKQMAEFIDEWQRNGRVQMNGKEMAEFRRMSNKWQSFDEGKIALFWRIACKWQNAKG